LGGINKLLIGLRLKKNLISNISSHK